MDKGLYTGKRKSKIKQHASETIMEKNEICIIQGTDYEQMTIRLLESTDLAGQIGNRKARIALKPNLVSPSPASLGATTHPEILLGIIRYLQSHGFADIRILEGSWVGSRTEESFAAAGYQAVCDATGVPFYDMKKEKAAAIDCAGMSIKVCKAVLDVDFLINVPVVKGHCQTKITCALKNLKGLLPDTEKRRFHSLGLHKPIAHLNAGIRQDFIVADNICGDLDYEDGGNPVQMDRILAARDPVLLDAYVCSLLHYEVRDVPYIPLAEKLSVGSADLKSARIRMVEGEAMQNVPLSRKVVELADAVFEVDSCSACYGYLIPALQMLKEEMEARGDDFSRLSALLGSRICIGQGFRGKTGEIGIGSCTRLFRHSLEGCPPTEEQIYGFLSNYLSRNRQEV